MCVWLPLCVSVCARASLFKGTTARRKLNLPTWQLAPLITKSNTHQRMSNEALLRELWLTVGLGPTPQVWITYYVLLKPSLKYIDKWMVMSQTWQRFDLRQTASRRQSKSAVWTAHDHWTFLFNHGVRKTPSVIYSKQISAEQRRRGQIVSEKHCVAQPLPHSWGSRTVGNTE